MVDSQGLEDWKLYDVLGLVNFLRLLT